MGVGAVWPVDPVLAARAELLASGVVACCAAASADTGAAGATVAAGATGAVVCGAHVCSKCRWTIFRKHSLLPGLQSCLGFVSLHVVTASFP